MKKNFIYFFIASICLLLNSCGEDDSPFFDVDTTPPVITEITAVTNPSNDNTPDYTFSSTESGYLYFEGSCSSSTTSVSSGDNTITLNSLSDGTYSDCEISVSDTAANESNSITLTSFTIDSTAASLVETSAIDSSTNDSTPDYTFVSSEAGTITYSGSCSSSTTSAIAGTNTITLNTLSDGTYTDCKITVTDSLDNAVTLNISSFEIDTSEPTVISFATTADNQSAVAITDNMTVTFSEEMDTTKVTTNTSNSTCAGTIRVSSDNFSSCLQMSSSSPVSSNNITFTLEPSDNLAGETTYLVRVTTGVTDSAGNALSSQYADSTGFTTVDSTAPTVISFTTTADNQGAVVIPDNMTVTFSEKMDIATVTTNSDNTSCSGTLRVSSDNFNSCIQMSSSSPVSTDNISFTLDPSDNLTGGTTYLTKITTGVTDSAGNALSSQYDNSTGFTTAD